MSLTSTPKGDRSEPDRSFQHARWKVGWAEKHIQKVTDWVKEFVDAQHKAGAVYVTERAGGGVAVNNAEVPIDIALMAGDAIFSLRSALDCCWMGLQRAIHRDAAKATLPRSTTREELVASLKRASVEYAFKGADSFLVDTIRPYQSGKEVLWFAGRVDNWNKHNMLLVNAQQTSIINLTGRTAKGGTFEMSGNTIVGCNPDLAGIVGISNITDLEFDRETDTQIEVVLVSQKPIDERALVPFLTALLKDTRDAVELFQKEFGRGVPVAV